MAEELLAVDGLCAGYLGQDVVHDVSFTMSEGEAVAVIGSNGAGKSTLFRAICGLLDASSGTVRFGGVQVAGSKAYRISRAGLAYVPAERHLFPEMTVRDNLYLGSYPQRPDPERVKLVFDLFPVLAQRQRQHAGTMSGGEQQMLAVGRSLMSKPRLLMLDEPTTGLAPILASQAYAALAELRSHGLTVLVAEQNVPLALGLAERGYVMENGRIQLAGTSTELARNPDVRRAYLGVA